MINTPMEEKLIALFGIGSYRNQKQANLTINLIRMMCSE